MLIRFLCLAVFVSLYMPHHVRAVAIYHARLEAPSGKVVRLFGDLHSIDVADPSMVPLIGRSAERAQVAIIQECLQAGVFGSQQALFEKNAPFQQGSFLEQIGLMYDPHYVHESFLLHSYSLLKAAGCDVRALDNRDRSDFLYRIIQRLALYRSGSSRAFSADGSAEPVVPWCTQFGRLYNEFLNRPTASWRSGILQYVKDEVVGLYDFTQQMLDQGRQLRTLIPGQARLDKHIDELDVLQDDIRVYRQVLSSYHRLGQLEPLGLLSMINQVRQARSLDVSVLQALISPDAHQNVSVFAGLDHVYWVQQILVDLGYRVTHQDNTHSLSLVQEGIDDTEFARLLATIRPLHVETLRDRLVLCQE